MSDQSRPFHTAANTSAHGPPLDHAAPTPPKQSDPDHRSIHDPLSDLFNPRESDDPRLTTRRQIEAYLKDAGDYARLLVENSQDMIIAVDLTLRIVEFNPAAERAFGYARDEVLGRSVEMLYAEPEAGWRVRIRTFGDGFHGRVRNRRKNGEIFTSQLTSTPLTNDRGELIGVMGISRDITQQVHMEHAIREHVAAIEQANLELKRAHESARRADDSLCRSLAAIGREVRRPISTILDLTKTLLDPASSELQLDDAARSIDQKSRRILELLDDIPEFAGFDAATPALNPPSPSDSQPPPPPTDHAKHTRS